jgi:hypothetical protein
VRGAPTCGPRCPYSRRITRSRASLSCGTLSSAAVCALRSPHLCFLRIARALLCVTDGGPRMSYLSSSPPHPPAEFTGSTPRIPLGTKGYMGEGGERTRPRRKDTLILSPRSPLLAASGEVGIGREPPQPIFDPVTLESLEGGREASPHH